MMKLHTNFLYLNHCRGFVLGCLVLGMPFVAQAQPTPAMKSAPTSDDEGFVQIFDGKTLADWSGDEAFWSVEDGALTGVTDGSLKANSFIT